MFYLGQSITQPSDPLQKIGLEALVQHLRQPAPPLRSLIGRLRVVAGLDTQQYRKLKTQLPYFVTASFHPAIRRRENFAAAHALVIDLDHLSLAGLDVAQARARCATDPRVLLAFASPSLDGLKVVVPLARPCADAGQYALFYKALVPRWAQSLGLGQCADLRTHDVTRATFLSLDPDLYCQPAATPVVVDDYVDGEDLLAAGQIEREHRALLAAQPPPPPEPDTPLDDDVLALVRARLRPGGRLPKPAPNHYQPERLLAAMPPLTEALAAAGLTVLAERPIQYGRQVQAGRGPLWGEVNIFYGQRGFSVVKTTKTGSHPELAELLRQLVEQLLWEMPAAPGG
jgi:hypothetical protein